MLNEIRAALGELGALDTEDVGSGSIVRLANGETTTLVPTSTSDVDNRPATRLGEEVTVVVADQIPKAKRQEFNDQRWSWLDRRGHLRFPYGNIWIDADVAPTRHCQTVSATPDPLREKPRSGSHSWHWTAGDPCRRRARCEAHPPRARRRANRPCPARVASAPTRYAATPGDVNIDGIEVAHPIVATPQRRSMKRSSDLLDLYQLLLTAGPRGIAAALAGTTWNLDRQVQDALRVDVASRYELAAAALRASTVTEIASVNADDFIEAIEELLDLLPN